MKNVDDYDYKWSLISKDLNGSISKEEYEELEELNKEEINSNHIKNKFLIYNSFDQFLDN